MAPENATMDESVADGLLAGLPFERRGDMRWLAPARAFEVTVGPVPGGTTGDPGDAGTLKVAQAALEQVRATGRDAALLPARARRKKLLISDMDSTIIEQECIDEIADFAGLRAEVSGITERAMRGELNFESALKERVALLEGLTRDTLQQVVDERLSLMPGARTLVRTMRENGAICALVSGGFTFFTEEIAERTGFHTHQANTLHLEDGVLNGQVAEPILGADAKRTALQELAARHDIPMEATLAVGDGANDLQMIRQAGLGVAYHAKPIVAEQAAVRIDHCDLTALLYIQGYTATQFICD